ncbi:MAG: cupin domain-containing protein, partial [Alphaproteobacteria bacterium]
KEETMFFEYNKIDIEELGEGSFRKILASDDKLTIIEVSFEQGAKGTPHLHKEYDQVTYILEGSFEFTIDNQKHICYKGDSFYIHPNIFHGITCLKAGKVLDIFTPQRQDIH